MPLEGVPPIRLGMTRPESRSAMQLECASFEKSRGQTVDTYFDSVLQVFFSQGEEVEYIEVSRSKSLTVRFRGSDVFRTPADILVAELLPKVGLKSDDGGHSFIAPGLELSLWRPTLPDSNDDTDGKYFSTIGIGVPGYHTRAA